MKGAGELTTVKKVTTLDFDRIIFETEVKKHARARAEVINMIARMKKDQKIVVEQLMDSRGRDPRERKAMP